MKLNLSWRQTNERQEGSRKSVANNAADLMRENYMSQIRLQNLKSTLADGHPRLVATTREVEEAKTILSKETDSRQENMDDINPVYQELKSERTRQQTLLAGLTAGQIKLEAQKRRCNRPLSALTTRKLTSTDWSRTNRLHDSSSRIQQQP